MKKLIFANCILAIAVIFSFCAKPDLKEELSSVNNDQVASNRVPCTLSSVGPVFNVATLTLCGTNTTMQKCFSCLVPGAAVGVEVFQGPWSLVLDAPVTFSITSDLATSINLVAGNALAPTVFAAGQCRRFHIDASCVITEI
ncbi:MAG: hypothetical protein H7246_13200 [Phycisphaerae bacterium]|nr:hypothetical protein [Saprospiraceae bacterium]